MAEETTNKKRPALLTVLCILSFIGSGLSVLVWLLLTVGIGGFLGFLESVPGFSEAMTGSGAGMGVGIMVLNLVLNGGTLAGAIIMWQLKKIGFWIYSGAFVLQFILPLILMSAKFSFFGLIIMALFITLYALNLKHME
jgi:hypothetical protein